MFTDKVQRKLIWQQVLEDLRKKIILDEIKGGEHLKEAELSNQLGVSRGPIREAIVQLEKEGLVQTLKNGRTKVIGFTIKDVDDLYYSRIIIETAAIEQLNDKLEKEWLDEMKKLVDAMETDGLSKSQINHLDLRFHYNLVQLSNNKTLIQMWLSISELIKTIMKITNERTASKRDRVLHHHKGIMEALLKDDKTEVKKALETHLLFAKDVLKSFFNTIKNEV